VVERLNCVWRLDGERSRIVSSGAVWGLAIATFAAAAVEVVEALTVVLAMGVTRSWKSALTGTGVALLALAGFTAVTGYALVTWLPRSALQLTVGTLLLIFGLQWLRKAILRSAGRKALHDEDTIFQQQTSAARTASGEQRLGLDWFSFVVSLKAVFLEGVEVVFIVITFGLNAHNVPVAVLAAAAATLVIVAAGVLARAPLSRVPENTLKYGVGLMLATFGTFWAVEGLGVLRPGGQSLPWPGSDVVLVALLAGWFLLSRGLVTLYRRSTPADATPAGAIPRPAHRSTAPMATEEV
jgi:Ca2+/H+ antiporter, TMEM165/GDT1 family